MEKEKERNKILISIDIRSKFYIGNIYCANSTKRTPYPTGNILSIVGDL